MRVLEVTHPSGLHHDTGPNHPERPQRLAAVVRGIEESGLAVVRLQAPRVDRSDLVQVHDASYVDRIEAFCAAGGGSLDPDTHVGPESWEAAVHSAGAGVAAVAELEHDGAGVAFVATRPPGHHALEARAMGFCIFNNIAITARHLTRRGYRVAIFDWDVHHGNGTQDIFYRDPDVLYISIHESPWYPGTGTREERGAGDGAGTTINLPVPAGTTGDVYRWLARHVVVRAIESFGPDWLLISAGYDAHRLDPLALIELEADDYAALAGAVRATVPEGRTIFFLEGGYRLDAMSDSVAATLRGAAGDHGSLPELDDVGTGAAWTAAIKARSTFDREPR